MSVSVHTLALLFALPAGILFYFVLITPGQPGDDMRPLCAATLLFCIPLFGYPEAAGAFVLYFGIGLVLTWRFRRWTHEHRTKPPPDPDPPETDDEGQPVIFPDQRDDT